ncbi:MAG TPA: RagB/SusD family nutrient uptake outer membrane protein, partial [Puia sp.]
MKIHKILTAVLFVGLPAIFSGCKKSLQEKPYSFYNETQILKTADDARNLLLGAYNPLSNDYNMLRLPYWIAIDLDNDHITGPSWLFGNTGSGDYVDFWGMNGIWLGHYQIVGRCNEVLAKVPPLDIDETIKNNILGEAHALRAWAYFSLVRMYGEVPIKMKTLETDPEFNTPRSSVKDIYDFIIQDLNDANTLLLPKDDPKGGGPGRINKAAAQALLAKVYLTMASGAQKGASLTVRGGKDNGYYTHTQNGVAGYEGFNPDSCFMQARDIAAGIMDGSGGGGQFSLVPAFKDVFSKAQIDGPEAIWYLEFKDGSNTVNPLNMYYSPTSVKRGYGGWAWLTDNF